MFDRDKKNGPGAGEASLIDTDMRITGSVTSVGDIILAGSVDGEIKCITHTGVFDGVIKTGGIKVENGAHVTAKFRKRRR